MSPTAKHPPCVYLMYGEGDQPIYIGVTTRAVDRIRAHSLSEWWAQVRRIELEHFADPVQAYDRERFLIYTLNPAVNRRVPLPAPPLAEEAAEGRCSSCNALIDGPPPLIDGPTYG